MKLITGLHIYSSEGNTSNYKNTKLVKYHHKDITTLLIFGSRLAKRLKRPNLSIYTQYTEYSQQIVKMIRHGYSRIQNFAPTNTIEIKYLTA